MIVDYVLGILTGVTPRRGVWIEITSVGGNIGSGGVTPRRGVWIEIASGNYYPVGLPSLPVGECGLKS